MGKVRLIPYKTYSASGKALAESLGALRLKEKTNFKPTPGTVIINWGRPSETFPESLKKFGANFMKIFNPPEVVTRASNKKTFFESIINTPVVPWTTDKPKAEEWLADGETVVVRTKLRASGADGIILVDPGKGVDIPTAPLYTLYVKKAEEYRIHVFQGSVIDVQKKILRPEGEAPEDWRIRNHENGFIFVRDTACPNQKVLDASKLAVSELGLDFGAVDVIWNNKKQEAFVLEINTAPGLAGQTVDKYKEAFQNALSYLRSEDGI